MKNQGLQPGDLYHIGLHPCSILALGGWQEVIWVQDALHGVVEIGADGGVDLSVGDDDFADWVAVEDAEGPDPIFACKDD